MSLSKPEILAALRSFRFNDIGFADTGEPMPLVDMLTLEAEPDIGNALKRQDDLADHLFVELILPLRQAAEKAREAGQ